MTAQDVYNITKALSEDERQRLYGMLSKDQIVDFKQPKYKVISQKEAINYLIKSHFSKFFS